MRIDRQVIEAKSRTITSNWSIFNAPKVHYGREIDNIFFIKNFVPWAKTYCDGQTLFNWWVVRMMTNEITKEIDKEIIQSIKSLQI